MKNFLSLFLLAVSLVFFAGCEKPISYDKNEIPNDFEPLAKPADGEGYQIHVPAFPIPANFEREWFMRKRFGNTEDMYVRKFETKSRPGTHHLIAYGYENEANAELPAIDVMRDQNGPDGRVNLGAIFYETFIYFLSQEPNFELEFPEGIVMKIPAGATVDLNSHYFNVTDKTLFGEVYLNAYTVPESEVEKVLVFDAVDNDDILVLPPNKTTTIIEKDKFDETVEIRMMISHMHKRGTLFKAFHIKDENDEGELIYSTNDYEHPPTKFFNQVPLIIKEGEGIRTEITYKNETNRTIRYGVTSEDEMGILFYTYAEPK